MLTQNTPARAIRGQVVDVRATMKVTSGGSRDSEAKDWHAKPWPVRALDGRGGDDGDPAGEVPEDGPELGGGDRRPLVLPDGPQVGTRQGGVEQRIRLRRGGGGGAD